MLEADRKEEDKTLLLGWVAALAGILGAGLLASNTSISGYGWFAYMMSSTSWCMIALKSKSSPLLVMNGVYTAINMIGILRWMS